MTSRSVRQSTGPPTTAGTPTSRRSCCAGSPNCTSTSREPSARNSVGLAEECYVGDQPNVGGHRRSRLFGILLPHRFGDPSVPLEGGPRTVFLRQRFDAGFLYQPGYLVHEFGKQGRVRGGGDRLMEHLVADHASVTRLDLSFHRCDRLIEGGHLLI